MLAERISEQVHTVRELTIDGHEVRDANVVVSPLINRLPVDAVLGADFLRQFESAKIDFPRSTLTFTVL